MKHTAPPEDPRQEIIYKVRNDFDCFGYAEMKLHFDLGYGDGLEKSHAHEVGYGKFA